MNSPKAEQNGTRYTIRVRASYPNENNKMTGLQLYTDTVERYWTPTEPNTKK